MDIGNCIQKRLTGEEGATVCVRRATGAGPSVGWPTDRKLQGHFKVSVSRSLQNYCRAGQDRAGTLCCMSVEFKATGTTCHPKGWEQSGHVGRRQQLQGLTVMRGYRLEI